ncbi:transcriptional regulator [Oceanobacillus iheyensis HTE831]|uniref:Transcriptional regulator n=1 Tax=Oceanobacillus iheyensis (strain DSM 14371 / CIP 107618 / JCM 11309 / KCTC 3954 / HTE831) TaxID=221109 RepID=Q8ERF5_OCEIH|nr:sigma-54-dependent Fis family transcriptional regulator [Oceanobacillus iheyensis]BAC13304.1 transcriptional regulator [Oceanobacillus iheyensis HTE831]
MNDYFFEQLLEAEDDAITIVDTDRRVLHWNNAAVDTYNIEKTTIIGKPITNFFAYNDLMVMKVLDSKQAVQNQYHRPRKDKHVVVNTLPVFDNNQDLIGAISVERDITQIVKLNDNLESTSAELNELRQKVYPANSTSPFVKLKGKSNALQQIIQLARKAASTNATALILGESGTGKEVCAKAIHEASDRRNQPFIPVNCGAIPSALFESELFGYEGGSFTGAEKKGKAGKIEMADGGTLFLDEVGELPLEMQVKLLRVLQENRIYRIGDSQGKQVNVRFIAATNQKLEQLMDEKQFRSDLFYRLNVIQLTMPPLRERLEDIEILAKSFSDQFAKKYQVLVPEISEEAYEYLNQYKWPGNIRELRNLMERIIILHENSLVKKEDMQRYLPQATDFQSSETSSNLPLEKELMEKQLIEATLQQLEGNKSKAAEKLGISRVTLYHKIKKYNITV